MEVLILSKTKYGNTQVCVGGICVNSKQFVRLLNQGGYYQPSDTRFNIGDIWDINFTVNSNRREPHNEDVTIHSYTFLRKIYPLETYIKNMGVPIWKNNISNIFEGKILWTNNGKGYFSENINNYPSHSVGFWISDVDLRYSNDSYIYENNGITKQIVYKGNQTALQVIPKGRLIRLSLAKWWKPEDSDIEERCYLQLSGWYEDQVEPVKKIESKPFVESKPIAKPITTPLNTTSELSNTTNSNSNHTIKTPTSSNSFSKNYGCYFFIICIIGGAFIGASTNATQGWIIGAIGGLAIYLKISDWIS